MTRDLELVCEHDLDRVIGGVKTAVSDWVISGVLGGSRRAGDGTGGGTGGGTSGASYGFIGLLGMPRPGAATGGADDVGAPPAPPMYDPQDMPQGGDMGGCGDMGMDPMGMDPMGMDMPPDMGMGGCGTGSTGMDQMGMDPIRGAGYGYY